MRKVFLLTLAVCVLLGAGTAMAAIQDSNHDMTVRYSALDARNGPCSFCHIPHGAQGDKLFPSTLTATGMPAGGWVDIISQICWDCHSSGTYNDALNVNPFQANAHLAVVNSLITWGDITAISASVYDVAGGNISCVSCHQIHDNTNRPFMRDNGVGDALEEGNLGTLCDDCHTSRFDNANTGTRRNHPVREDLTDSSLANIYAFATSVWSGFRNSYPASLTSEISIAAANRWNLGGKTWSSTAGTATYFDCATCHAVHSNETDDFTAGDGATAGISTPIAPNGSSLVVTATTAVISPTAPAAVCIGCHDITSDVAAGPGALASFSHPYATDVSATIGSLVPVIPADAPGLASDIIVCQSCHDMHFSRVQAGVGVWPANQAIVRNECIDCHTGSTTLNDHHPVGIVPGTNGTGTEADPPLTSTGVVWDTGMSVMNDSVTRNGVGGTAYAFTVLAGDDIMTCFTCHGSGNATAHNNNNSFPGLTGEMDEDEMCVDCHGVNPSDNTASMGQGAGTPLGSHMLGTMADSTYFWADEANSPQAGTIDYSHYGTDGAGNNQLICTSCHNLYIDGKNSHVVAPQSSDNTNNAGVLPQAVGLLLSSSGNDDSDADNANPNNYLCTGCHGTAPGGGTTHPVLHQAGGMSAASTVVAAGVVTDQASGDDGGVSLVGGDSGTVNCESCHRPHDAVTIAGTLILERAGTIGANLNESILCAACHTDKY
jgi:hypothetical protein